MKRIAVYVLRHMDYKHTNLTDMMRDCWRKEGVEYLQLPVSELSVCLRKLKCDEVMLYDDRLIGPIFALGQLFQRAKAVNTRWWRLAGNAPMAGLRKGVWQRQDVLAALQDVDFIVSLTALLGTATELFDTESLSNLTNRPMLDEPVRMAEAGCPFFEHELFHRDYDEVIISNLGHQGKLFYNWMYRHSKPWLDPIWDFLLPNFHQADIY